MIIGSASGNRISRKIWNVTCPVRARQGDLRQVRSPEAGRRVDQHHRPGRERDRDDDRPDAEALDQADPQERHEREHRRDDKDDDVRRDDLLDERLLCDHRGEDQPDRRSDREAEQELLQRHPEVVAVEEPEFVDEQRLDDRGRLWKDVLGRVRDPEEPLRAEKDDHGDCNDRGELEGALRGTDRGEAGPVDRAVVLGGPEPPRSSGSRRGALSGPRSASFHLHGCRTPVSTVRFISWISSMKSGSNIISTVRGRGSSISKMRASRPGRGVITTTRSARKIASLMLCVTKTIVLLVSAQRLQEQEVHLVARERVERAERLVHEQDLGILGQRPHDRRPLLHAARELSRIGRLEPGQPDLARPGASMRVPSTGRFLISNGNSMFCCRLRQGSRLASWNIIPISLRSWAVTLVPSSRISPPREGVQPGHRPEQGRLAAAARAEDA